MKQLFTLTCATLAVFSATAQTQRPSLYSRFANPKNFRQHVASMLQRQQDDHVAAKTTAMAQRVIGESVYDITGTPVVQDSTRYTYTGYNGSKFNFNDMYFNTTWPSNFNAGADYPYTFNKTDVMSTTMKSLEVNTSTNTLMPLESFYREYTGSNVKLSKDTNYSSGTLDYFDHYYTVYDAQNRLTKLYDLYYDASTPLDSSTRFDIYYDAQGRAAKDSIFQYNGGGWDAAGAVVYTYDANGNLTLLTVTVDIGGPSWIDFLTYTHTFYASNKIKTVVSAMYDQNAQSLVPSEKDSFAYDPTNKFTIMSIYYQYSNAAWTPMYKSDKHLNAQGLPDTVVNRSSNGTTLDISDRTIYTYSSYGNPVTGKNYVYNGTSFDAWTQHNYYYEVFNDLSGVDNMPTASSDFKLYPNPAKEQVNISSKASIGKQVEVDVINVSGQIISTEHSSWDNEVKSVSLAGLQPGIYWVRITDNAGAAIFHQSVIKQ